MAAQKPSFLIFSFSYFSHFLNLSISENMALIKEVNGLAPKWGKNCYFSENATIVGEVTMGDECSVWFNAVVRGDVAYIKIGDRTNVQDGACLHTTYKIGPLNIGSDVTIGRDHRSQRHRACLHHPRPLPHRHGLNVARQLRDWRRFHRGCRSLGSSGHKDRPRRDMGRRTCQVLEESAPRTDRQCRPLRGLHGLVSRARRIGFPHNTNTPFFTS